MDDEQTQNDLTGRLRAMGDEPVPGSVRDEHLRRIAATPIDPGRGFGRVWIAAAAIVGFLVGSTGLAAAGALPDPAQDVAHDVLAVVQVDVPEGKRGPCVSAIAKSDLPKAEKKAAKDACPKGGMSGDAPGKSGEAPGKSGSAPGQTKHAEDPCRGKPPWAGKNDLTKAEKDALKAERATACGRDLDDDDDDEFENEDDDEAEELEETEPLERDSESLEREPAPTTSAPTTSTTTTTTTTTTAPETTTTADASTTTAPNGSGG